MRNDRLCDGGISHFIISFSERRPEQHAMFRAPLYMKFLAIKHK